MKFLDRLDRLDRRLDGPRFNNSDGPTVIHIRGGLDCCQPLHATIEGRYLECEPGEPVDTFWDRAINAATDIGAKFVVISGLLLPV
jgi:hypothetical protein